jgi:hypothetical protein
VRVQKRRRGAWEKGVLELELRDSWGQGTCQGPDSFLIVEFVAKIHAAEWIIFRAA